MADNNSAASVSKRSEEEATKPPAKKARLSLNEINELSKDELIARWKEHEEYLEDLEAKQALNSELAGLRESEEKLKLQQQESTRRENVLVMRLATKEQEMQDLLTQIQELKEAQNPSTVQLRKTLLDPAVNMLFQQMKNELEESKQKLEQAQSDLSAWKFTADSVTGKKLMAKCRKLIQENQDLGRQLSQGRVAQLEAELSLQKKYSEEMKSSQDELNDFVIQLDEEVEGMQSTILTLQQQLKETKQQFQQNGENAAKLAKKVHELEEEVSQLREQIKDLTERKIVDLAQERTDCVEDKSTSMDTEQIEETKEEPMEVSVELGKTSTGEDNSNTEPTERGEESPSQIDNGEVIQINGERTNPDSLSLNASQTNLFTISKILETDSRTKEGGVDIQRESLFDKLDALKDKNGPASDDTRQCNGEVVLNKDISETENETEQS